MGAGGWVSHYFTVNGDRLHFCFLGFDYLSVIVEGKVFSTSFSLVYSPISPSDISSLSYSLYTFFPPNSTRASYMEWNSTHVVL